MGTLPPALRGQLSDGGVMELLRECESRRLTGMLRFTGTGPDAGVDGAVRLFGGEIAVDQERRDDGQDPVDVLLDLESASYELQPILPPLPVSRGTDVHKTGSLAVHVPVDLMSYCEQAGLTGVLELTHEGRKAEAFYEGGELLAIELDGRDATDLHEVFAWEQGRFRVTLDLEAPTRVAVEPDPIEEPSDDGWSPAPPQKRENTRQFLRVVEMALVDVLDQSEKARSPTRTSPPLPPPPKARPRPQSVPPPRLRTRGDQTVKLVYLTAEPSPVTRAESVESTRHVRSDVDAEVVGAPARSDRRADEEEPMSKKRRKKAPSGTASREAKPEPKAEAAAKAAPEKKPEAKKPEAKKPEAKKAEAKTPEKPEPKSHPKPVAKSGSEPAKGPAPAADPAAALKQIGGATAWALGVVVLGLLILFVLGKLPPVQ
ncbi:MAG: DUF4388 domain-containing protein [Sandaracinaceae bacterium]|nr:DUF4388 domain-containing protein [Sandaracinaceae bacterium]